MKLLLIGSTSAIAQGVKPYLDYEITEASLRDGLNDFDVDIIVNCAGVAILSDLSYYHNKAKELIEVNCHGPVRILNMYIQGMRARGYGRIIFLSSVCAEINLKEHGLYSASKAFVDKLVKIAAIENGEYGITVNSIQLGYTGIGMSENTSENMERQKQKTALKRFCTMKELAQTIDYIVNTEYLTGQNIRLDGGIK